MIINKINRNTQSMVASAWTKILCVNLAVIKINYTLFVALMCFTFELFKS